MRSVIKLRLAVVLIIFLLIAILAAGWAFFIEPALITVTRISITDEALPSGWDGKSIVFFSDLHLGPAFDLGRLEKTVAKINQLEPDIILFGGDIIDYRTPDNSSFAGQASEILSTLEAGMGKFAVLGNHDNRLSSERRLAIDILGSGGFTVLINQSISLDGLILAGVDETYFGNPNLGEALENRLDESNRQDDDDYTILLCHQPDYAAAHYSGSANLILAGHSHNGQITLLGHPLVTVYQGELYPYGLYDLNQNCSLIVSRGLGTVGPSARLFNPPEIMQITMSSRSGS